MNQLRDISRGQRYLKGYSGCWWWCAPLSATLRESGAVFVGEADFSFGDLCDGPPLSEIPGLYYRDGDTVVSTVTSGESRRSTAPGLELLSTHSRPPSTMAEFSVDAFLSVTTVQARSQWA